MKFLIALSFLFCTLIASNSALCQQDSVSYKKDKIMRVILKRDVEYKGVIIGKDQESIILKTDLEELKLYYEDIRIVEEYNYFGKFEYENPHSHRYFLSPSGIPLKSRRTYFQYSGPIFFGVGLTEHLSVTGGFELLTLTLGIPFWYISPKIGFDISKNKHASGGVILSGIHDFGSAYLGYGVFTLGNGDHNISFGSAYGSFDGSLMDYPTLMLSGTYRIFNKYAIHSENHIFPANPGSVYFGIHGIKYIYNQKSYDIGAIFTPLLNGFDPPIIPCFSFARVF